MCKVGRSCKYVCRLSYGYLFDIRESLMWAAVREREEEQVKGLTYSVGVRGKWGKKESVWSTFIVLGTFFQLINKLVEHFGWRGLKSFLSFRP